MKPWRFRKGLDKLHLVRWGPRRVKKDQGRLEDGRPSGPTTPAMAYRVLCIRGSQNAKADMSRLWPE